VTLEALRCFCAVVEEQSFHGAARRLHRSQPAISHQVRALEKETGQSLVDRRTVRPTPAGAQVYDRARRLLADADNLVRSAKSASGAPPSEIRIGCSDTVALYLLPKAVRTFTRTHSETAVRLLSRSTGELLESVKRGELDIAIVTLPVRDDTLSMTPFAEQRFVLVARTDHPLAKRKRVRLDAIGSLPYLQLDPNTRTGQFLRDRLRKAGIAPPVAIDSGSFEVIKRYVAEGVGVALLPEMAMANKEKGLVAIRVPELPPIEFGAVWPVGGYRHPTVESFLKLATGATLES